MYQNAVGAEVVAAIVDRVPAVATVEHVSIVAGAAAKTIVAAITDEVSPRDAIDNVVAITKKGLHIDHAPYCFVVKINFFNALLRLVGNEFFNVMELMPPPKRRMTSVPMLLIVALVGA